MTNDSFEIVLDGKTRQIEIKHITDRQYDVLMDGTLVGLLWGREKSKFICSTTDGQPQFAGSTRRLAVTSMLYACYKEESRIRTYGPRLRKR